MCETPAVEVFLDQGRYFEPCFRDLLDMREEELSFKVPSWHDSEEVVPVWIYTDGQAVKAVKGEDSIVGNLNSSLHRPYDRNFR